MRAALSRCPWILLPLFIGLSACGGGDSGTAAPSDTSAPTINSVNPANQTSSLSPAASISVTFNEAIDDSSISASSFAISSAAGAVTGSFSSSGNTVTFVPSSKLQSNTTYTMTLSTAIKDKAGNVLVAPYSGSFTTAWTQQYGSSSNDYVAGIALDASGDQYITGYTYGSLGSNSNQGGADVFLIKYNASGVQQWVKQLGSSADDFAANVVVDKTSGMVYIVGHTLGSMSGTSAGGYDYFLAQYDSSGTQLWLKQKGGAFIDIAYGITLDNTGNIYVAGSTGGLFAAAVGGSDIFMIKYDSAGNETAIKTQLSSPASDIAYAVTVDLSGNIYLGGDIGTEGYNEAIGIYSYSNTMTSRWGVNSNTVGTDEKILGMAVDSSGNLYVTGLSYGALFGSNSGSADLFVTKYNGSNGAVIWQTQSGTASYDNGLALVLSGGSLYLTGSSGGNLEAGQYAGGNDAFLQKMDASTGAVTWIRQFGSAANDDPAGLDLDGSGNIYIAGTTHAGFGGNSHNGGGDLFMVKYDSAGTRL